MKTVCSLMLTCMTAVSALAGDSAEMLRDRLIVCNQGREVPLTRQT
jgi:hypothetical protein